MQACAETRGGEEGRNPRSFPPQAREIMLLTEVWFFISLLRLIYKITMCMKEQKTFFVGVIFAVWKVCILVFAFPLRRTLFVFEGHILEPF